MTGKERDRLYMRLKRHGVDVARPYEQHGNTRSAEYGVFKQMHQRCENQAVPNYDDYGGRGIRVCSSWDSFSVFLADMGRRPSSKHQLDRQNNEGSYGPHNCRWATKQEQMLNTRVTNRQGDLIGAKAIAESLGVSLRTYFRHKR